MNTIHLTRATYFRAVLELHAAQPGYVWSARSEAACDCSGYVAVALLEASKGLMNFTGWNTDLMWNNWPHIDAAEVLPGDLVFYWGDSKDKVTDVSHVMVCVGAGLCVGMGWGSRSDTDVRMSKAQGKTSLVRPVDYRKDVAGFVRPPVV